MGKIKTSTPENQGCFWTAVLSTACAYYTYRMTGVEPGILDAVGICGAASVTAAFFASLVRRHGRKHGRPLTGTAFEKLYKGLYYGLLAAALVTGTAWAGTAALLSILADFTQDYVIDSIVETAGLLLPMLKARAIEPGRLMDARADLVSRLVRRGNAYRQTSGGLGTAYAVPAGENVITRGIFRPGDETRRERNFGNKNRPKRGGSYFARTGRNKNFRQAQTGGARQVK